jgi:hypothetical protein
MEKVATQNSGMGLEKALSVAPFPLIRVEFRIGLERSRARWFSATKSTVDGENRYEKCRWGKGRGTAAVSSGRGNVAFLAIL